MDHAEEGDLYQVRLRGVDEERVAYEGPFESVFLSGLPDGDYTLHVRHRRSSDEPWGAWSPPLTLAVSHHSLVLAYGLFAAGGVMVLCIIGFLVRHARNEGTATEGRAA